MRPIFFILLLACCALGANAQGAVPAHYVLAGEPELTLPQATEKVRQKVGGRVLGAKTIEREDRTLYEIKILLKPGQVKVYWVDPATGGIL